MDQERDETGQHPPTPPEIRKTLQLLAELRNHPAGLLIYQQVERLLTEAVAEAWSRERGYAALLGTLLDACAERLPAHDPMRLRIRLIQRRLQPPLLSSELDSLQHYADGWAKRLSEIVEEHEQGLEDLLEPLLGGLGAADTMSARGTTQTGRAAPTLQPGAEQRVNLAYRHHLDEKNREVQRLQATLADQIEETIRQHQEFGVSLEVALSELKRQKDARLAGETRDYVLGQIEKFLGEQRTITDKLGETYQTLQTVSEGSRTLSDELDRVRQLSLTDELSGLPNRRAFQRRLEDEAARVNRYGYPLTLAMLDLDDFKAINDTYGHAVGDRVLVTYADQALSIFRHHDMVARYGGEEFAVLLPNTGLSGVLRALEKVRARVAELTIHTDHEQIEAPTFSAGVAVYHPGETADHFVSRADAALYHAKRGGRDRVETAHEDRPRGASLS